MKDNLCLIHSYFSKMLKNILNSGYENSLCKMKAGKSDSNFKMKTIIGPARWIGA